MELRRLEEEKELKEKRDEEYLSKKYQLLGQLSEHSSDEEDWKSSAASVKVNNWLSVQAKQKQQLVTSHDVLLSYQMNDEIYLTTTNQYFPVQQQQNSHPTEKHFLTEQLQQPMPLTSNLPNQQLNNRLSFNVNPVE